MPTPEYAAQIEARRKAAKKRSRQNAVASVIAITVGAILGLALLAGIVALSALLTMLAWNYGVVALVAACGGAVSKIGFGTAICVNLAMGIVGRLFRRPAPAKVTTKA